MSSHSLSFHEGIRKKYCSVVSITALFDAVYYQSKGPSELSLSDMFVYMVIFVILVILDFISMELYKFCL